jgi:SAM-dependent methyltransferase
MLMSEPDAALRETRRILRPGGRLALATWDTPDRNLWMAAPAIQLVARGALPPPDPAAPGPFAMADRDALARRLADAGFRDVRTEKLEMVQSYPDFNEYWQMTFDLAAPLRAALASLDEPGAHEVREGTRSVLAQFIAPDGKVEAPASALVASAVA